MAVFAERAQLLLSESERIKQYVHSLSADALSRPSACSQWQVQDVVAHLISVAETYASNLSRGLQGDNAPPAGRLPAGQSNAASSADSIAQRSIGMRQSLGNRLLATYDTTNDHLNRLLSGLRPEEQQTPCYHPGGIVAAQQFMDLRLKELALHEWDIRSGLEPHARLSTASYPAILDTISESIASGSLRWAFWSGPTYISPVRYRFIVKGPGPRQPDLVVDGNTLRMEDAGQAQPDVTFRCDTETYILLVYGRIDLNTALPSGRLVSEGDRELALAFGQWFRGI